MPVLSHSATLVANTALTFTLSQWSPTVRVVNRGGTEAWARADGTAAVVGADENFVVPPNQSVDVPNPRPAPDPGAAQTSNTTVSVISTAAVPITVEELV